MAVTENLEERVKKIITEQLAVDAAEVTPQAQFVQGLLNGRGKGAGRRHGGGSRRIECQA